MKKPFTMIEPLTGLAQSSKEVKFGAPKVLSKTEQALAKLVAKSIEEQSERAS